MVSGRDVRGVGDRERDERYQPPTI
jgi:hypothetical protein